MDFSTLTTCRLFRGLSIEEIKTIIGNISCYIKHYEEGETVYHLMSKADRIGIILKGRVQAQKIIPNGNQFNFSVRQAGELLGPAAAFSDVRKYPFEVKANSVSILMNCRYYKKYPLSRTENTLFKQEAASSHTGNGSYLSSFISSSMALSIAGRYLSGQRCTLYFTR